MIIENLCNSIMSWKNMPFLKTRNIVKGMIGTRTLEIEIHEQKQIGNLYANSGKRVLSIAYVMIV